MPTARALHSAKSAVAKAQRVVVASRAELKKATVCDSRLFALLSPTDPKRLKYNAAVRGLAEAERVLTEARDKAAMMRKAANGKANGKEKATPRTILANVITAERKVEAAKRRKQAAIDNSYPQSAAARRKLEAAERDLEKAPERDAEAAAQALAAGKPPPPPTLAKAEARVAAAKTEVEQIGVGREHLERQRREIEREHEDVKRQKQTAIDDVLRAEWPLAGLLDEVARLSERRAVKLLILREWSAFATPDERRLIDQAKAAPQPYTADEGYHFAQHATVLAIKQMRAALAVDSAAPIERL
jgi:hypothetical protein